MLRRPKIVSHFQAGFVAEDLQYVDCIDPIFIQIFGLRGIVNKKLSYCWETVRRESMP